MSIVEKKCIQEWGFHDPMRSIRAAIEERKWGEFAQQPGAALVPVVREFYANAREHKNYKALVRGKWVPFDRTTINNVYNLPDIPDDEYSQFKSQEIDFELANELGNEIPRFRSSGAKKKSLKEDALDSLKAMQAATVEPGKPPSPVQVLLGALSAGVIALLLCKFTTTIEAALNRQTLSDSFSVRQITITIRTIMIGSCYLATFIFGINSLGLMLYAGQPAISSLMEPSPSNPASDKEDEPPSEDPLNDVESKGKTSQQSSNDSQ